ncbi:hypothetical protein BT96DRAFT_960672 [Gymnopus androsaceus JB14]|uniref:EXPERA domain-containing protein n=1 Tax=Gymnopus androsaceus JB14 TaxID=1447944 RepID=A0A6A4GJN6_9AGAR|nr:hypothetical protein BT96DRAFT_960672 [Gymnopus androsaceus JB14]
MSRIPLTARPMDLIYFCFFISHIPASLLLDFQMLYPSALVPSFLSELQNWYIKFSADPLISGAVRGELLGELFWLKCSRSIYVLILAYGASTATTTLPCIFYILKENAKITSEQQLILLSSYIPFFLIPLMMAVDMVFRLYSIVASSDVKQKAE